MKSWGLGLLIAAVGGGVFACGTSSGGTCQLSCPEETNAAAGPTGAGGSSSATTGSGMDPPDCLSCVDAVTGAQGQTCQFNGPPSSTALKDDFDACACNNGTCAQACIDYCGGSAVSGECLTCFQGDPTCSAVLSGCGNDLGGGTTGATGAGGGGACITCSESVFDGIEGELCPSSQAIYETFFACTCAGPCEPLCADNACVAVDAATPECGDCLTNGPCAEQFGACIND